MPRLLLFKFLLIVNISKFAKLLNLRSKKYKRYTVYIYPICIYLQFCRAQQEISQSILLVSEKFHVESVNEGPAQI